MLPLSKGFLRRERFFVGPWAAQALGDYTSAAQCLPTGGWARQARRAVRGGFCKVHQRADHWPKWFQRLAGDVRVLARAENLPAHENAVAVRE